jgi:mono/diheme cytochrome c family protein
VTRLVFRLGVIAAVTAAGLAGGEAASARTYEHARQTGKRCSTCHTSKAPNVTNLNPAGRYFLEHRTLEGFAAGGRAAKPPGAAPSAALRQGLAVYERACVMCHGARGKGTALAMPLTGDRKHATTDALAIEVITEGIAGTAMMPFKGVLSEREIREVARYIMTMKPAGGGR